jgi:hypothetical protein
MFWRFCKAMGLESESTFDRCMAVTLVPLMVLMVLGVYAVLGMAAFKFAMWAVQ